MATCAKNKDTHPGYADLLSPHCEALELGTNGQKSTEEKEEKALQCTEAAKKAVALQDHLHQQDQEREDHCAKQCETSKKGLYALTKLTILIAATNTPAGECPPPAEKRAAPKSSANQALNKENIDPRTDFITNNEPDIESAYYSVKNVHIFTYFTYIISGNSASLDEKIVWDRQSSRRKAAAKSVSAFRRNVEETSSGCDGECLQCL